MHTHLIHSSKLSRSILPWPFDHWHQQSYVVRKWITKVWPVEALWWPGSRKEDCTNRECQSSRAFSGSECILTTRSIPDFLSAVCFLNYGKKAGGYVHNMWEGCGGAGVGGSCERPDVDNTPFLQQMRAREWAVMAQEGRRLPIIPYSMHFVNVPPVLTSRPTFTEHRHSIWKANWEIVYANGSSL